MTTAFIGQPISRVDGRQKVTGRATYAAEYDVPGVVHGAIVRSTVAKGRIANIDSTAAERAPGVIAVVTHRNAPRLAYRPHRAFVDPDTGERLHVLQDDQVSHQGQPIALVIADTLEHAVHATTLVRMTYASETGATDIERVEPVSPARERPDQPEQRPSETRRGDPDRALGSADIKVDQTYVIPRENQPDRDARHHCRLGWRSPDALGQDAVGVQRGRRDRGRIRHSVGEPAGHLAFCGRRVRFRPAHVAACDTGGARRARSGATSQGDAVAAPSAAHATDGRSADVIESRRIRTPKSSRHSAESGGSLHR
jgi:hypothetical protein